MTEPAVPDFHRMQVVLNVLEAHPEQYSRISWVDIQLGSGKLLTDFAGAVVMANGDQLKTVPIRGSTGPDRWIQYDTVLVRTRGQMMPQHIAARARQLCGLSYTESYPLFGGAYGELRNIVSVLGIRHGVRI